MNHFCCPPVMVAILSGVVAKYNRANTGMNEAIPKRCYAVGIYHGVESARCHLNSLQIAGHGLNCIFKDHTKSSFPTLTEHRSNPFAGLLIRRS